MFLQHQHIYGLIHKELLPAHHTTVNNVSDADKSFSVDQKLQNTLQYCFCIWELSHL